jgi:hypothetical protein
MRLDFLMCLSTILPAELHADAVVCRRTRAPQQDAVASNEAKRSLSNGAQRLRGNAITCLCAK